MASDANPRDELLARLREGGKTALAKFLMRKAEVLIELGRPEEAAEAARKAAACRPPARSRPESSPAGSSRPPRRQTAGTSRDRSRGLS